MAGASGVPCRYARAGSYHGTFWLACSKVDATDFAPAEADFPARLISFPAPPSISRPEADTCQNRTDGLCFKEPVILSS